MDFANVSTEKAKCSSENCVNCANTKSDLFFYFVQVFSSKRKKTSITLLRKKITKIKRAYKIVLHFRGKFFRDKIKVSIHLMEIF